MTYTATGLTSLSLDFPDPGPAERAAVLDYLCRVADSRPYENVVGAEEFARRYLPPDLE